MLQVQDLGQDIKIFAVLTLNASNLEKKFKEYFVEYNISNELFDLEHYDQYVQFIENNREINNDIFDTFLKWGRNGNPHLQNDIKCNYINNNFENTAYLYLFSLGTVKELRESLNIGAEYSDDMIVYKYGYTIEKNHVNKINKLKSIHNTLINEMKMEILEMNKKCEIMEKEMEKRELEVKIEMDKKEFSVELLKKELEIQQLKMINYQSENKLQRSTTKNTKRVNKTTKNNKNNQNI